MKNTQKKLKAKNFRYLSKEYVKDPMIYLDEFFEQQTKIDYWLRDINILINAATNAKINAQAQSTSYHIRQLIEQVEIAYVIFKKCAIKTQNNPLSFFASTKDYWNYVIDGKYTSNGITSPTDTISRFFSYQTLQLWYQTLDSLWINIGDRGDEFLHNQGNDILAVRELIQRLVVSLDKIREKGFLPYHKHSKHRLKR